MAALARRSVFDFIQQVNGQTPGSISKAVYSASQNTDGTVQITKNGVVLFAKVGWAMGAGVALTDINISGDSVSILGAEGTWSRGDCQQFILSLN